jgi:hypothetical protein
MAALAAAWDRLVP